MAWLSKLWLKLTKPAELLDWLGDGANPVSQIEAERRAKICASCPLNVPKNILIPLAIDAIRLKLKLRVPDEWRLKTCGACSCDLRLKVWVPYEHIKSWQRTSELEACRKANLDCWQL